MGVGEEMGSQGRLKLLIPKSANENRSVSVNCSVEEMGPKMHSVPAGIEWGYINKELYG